MSTEQLQPPRAPTGGTHLSVGTILIGAFLVLAGLVWFLSALDIYALSFGVLLAVLLILAGAALALDLVPSARGALTAFSIVMVVALSLMTLADVSFRGGAGDNTVTVQTMEQLQSSYNYGAGNQTFELQNLALPAGETKVTVELGAGNLTVRVPSNVAVQVKYHVGVGNTSVLGTEKDGLSIDSTYTSPGYAAADRRLYLDLSVGAGNLEVEQ